MGLLKLAGWPCLIAIVVVGIAAQVFAHMRTLSKGLWALVAALAVVGAYNAFKGRG